MDMIICEGCGCPVHPDFLQTHSDWHDSLVQRTETPDEDKLKQNTVNRQI